MRTTETLSLMLCTGVLVLAGCKSEKKADDNGTAKGTASGTAMGTATGTGSGTAMGTATGTGSGTASGTSDGSATGVATGDNVVFPLAKGESYYGGSAMETNVVAWKVEDGTIVYLAIVKTGTMTNGREDAVLRAYHPGSDPMDVGPKYSLDPNVDHWSELKLVSNERVLFRYGEEGKGPRARNGVLLRWDADAGRVRIAKRWVGTHDAPEPEWFATGKYVAAPESEDLCMKVLARMVACEKDPAFRESMFRRDDPAEKAAMQEHFDSHVDSWKSEDGARLQCQKWASDEYVDTHFSDTTALKQLATETKLDCGFFAAEIVDEGGLPTALVDAK